MRSREQTPDVGVKPGADDNRHGRQQDAVPAGLPWLSIVLCVVATVGLAWLYQQSQDPEANGQAFADALHRGDLEAVRRHIERGTEIEQRDAAHMTPLMTAAATGRPQLVRLLLAAGADRTQVSSVSGTSLFHAAGARQNSAECVRVLLGCGVSVDQPARGGRTPLMVAALVGNYEAAVQLIDAGANPNARDEHGQTALWYAAASHGDVALLRLLLALGCSPHDVDHRGRTALHDAAAHGTAQSARILVAAGADRGLLDGAGQTALDVAANRGDAALLYALGARPAAMPKPGGNIGPPAWQSAGAAPSVAAVE